MRLTCESVKRAILDFIAPTRRGMELDSKYICNICSKRDLLLFFLFQSYLKNLYLLLEEVEEEQHLLHGAREEVTGLLLYILLSFLILLGRI